MSSISESLSSAAPILIDSPQTAATQSQNALNPQIEIQRTLSIGNDNEHKAMNKIFNFLNCDIKKCPICLDDLNDPCHGDPCSHEFCFACFIKWTNIKAECPLCKEPIEIIRHNILSENVYDDFVIPPPLTEHTFTAHDFRPYQADQLELPEIENPAQTRNFFRKVIGVALALYLITIGTATASLSLFGEISEDIKKGIVCYTFILNGFSYIVSVVEQLSSSLRLTYTLLLSYAILNGVLGGIWMSHSISLYDFLLGAKYTLLIILPIVIRPYLHNCYLNDLRAWNVYLRKSTLLLHLLHMSIFLTYFNQNPNFNLTTLDGLFFCWVLNIFKSVPGILFIALMEHYCIDLLRGKTERLYRNRFYFPVIFLYFSLILLFFFVTRSFQS